MRRSLLHKSLICSLVSALAIEDVASKQNSTGSVEHPSSGNTTDSLFIKTHKRRESVIHTTVEESGKEPVLKPFFDSVLDPEQDLEWFFECLLSFFKGVLFDYSGFEQSVSTLKRDIMTIGDGVREVQDSEPQLAARLSFVQHVFWKMVEATGYLRFFNLRGPDHQILRSVIQLNLVYLGFFNDEGYPDPHTAEYEKKLAQYSHLLDIWGELFENISEVPLIVSVMFEKQYVEARRTLEYLKDFTAEAGDDDEEE